MAPGVRNSKRVRADTQSDVLPSESAPRTSKRLVVQDRTTPSDDNAAGQECSGTVANDNTSQEGNEAAGHDNTSHEDNEVAAHEIASVDRYIGAPNDDLPFSEGKL
jgi:hypothetical protein